MSLNLWFTQTSIDTLKKKKKILITQSIVDEILGSK